MAWLDIEYSDAFLSMQGPIMVILGPSQKMSRATSLKIVSEETKKSF